MTQTQPTRGLPVKLIADANYGYRRPQVELAPGGAATCRWRGWGYTGYELNSLIRDEIARQIDAQMPKHDYYWRGTNNRRECDLIRAGELRPSINHADNIAERGLSVSEHLGYVMMAGYRYGYRVRGEVIDRGSDGEAILAIDTLEPLDKHPRTLASIEKREHRQYWAARQQILATLGWSMDDYRASLWAYVADDYEAAFGEYRRAQAAGKKAQA